MTTVTFINMNDQIQLLSALAGILGLFVGMLALLRDVFDFKLKWSQSQHFIQRIIANKTFLTITSIVSLIIAYGLLLNQNYRLNKQIDTQTSIISEISTMDSVPPHIQDTIIAITQESTTNNVVPTLTLTTPIDILDKGTFADPFDAILRNEWQIFNPGLVITDGILQGRSGTIYLDTSKSNYRISTKLNGEYFRIYFRASTKEKDITSGYFFTCNRSYCEWGIVTNGSESTLAQPTDHTPFYTNFGDLVIEVSGRNFTATVDGKEFTSIADEAYTNGGIALDIYLDQVTQFDGIKIEEL